MCTPVMALQAASIAAMTGTNSAAAAASLAAARRHSGCLDMQSCGNTAAPGSSVTIRATVCTAPMEKKASANLLANSAPPAEARSADATATHRNTKAAAFSAMNSSGPVALFCNSATISDATNDTIVIASGHQFQVGPLQAWLLPRYRFDLQARPM